MIILSANEERQYEVTKELAEHGTLGGENFIRVEVDASTLPARFSIYRVGYDYTDDMYGDPNDLPYKTGLLPEAAINEANKGGVHTLSVTMNQSNVTVTVNGANAPTNYADQIAASDEQLADGTGRRPASRTTTTSRRTSASRRRARIRSPRATTSTRSRTSRPSASR